MDYACFKCGNRQDNDDACASCGFVEVLVLSNPHNEAKLIQTELALKQAYKLRMRMFGVVAGSLLLGTLWLIPGFQAYRAESMALPLYLDQIFLLLFAWWGISIFAQTVRPYRERYPYVTFYTARRKT